MSTATITSEPQPLTSEPQPAVEPERQTDWGPRRYIYCMGATAHITAASINPALLRSARLLLPWIMSDPMNFDTSLLS